MSEKAITELAEFYVENRVNGFAYPILPLDDFGNPPTHWEAGCVNYCVCVGVEVVNSKIEEVTEEGYTVIVNIESTWTSEEDNDNDEPYEQYEQSFQVLVCEEDGELKVSDFERVD